MYSFQHKIDGEVCLKLGAVRRLRRRFSRHVLSGVSLSTELTTLQTLY